MNEVLQLRRRAGLSQQQLAERSGVAQPNIAAYESGRRNPSAEMLERLRKAARPLPHDVLRAHRDELVTLAEHYGLTNVRVFGSVQRGDDGPGSDIDLLVSVRPRTGLLTIAAFAREAEELLGAPVDVVSEGGLRPGHKILMTAAAL
jgi:predicted nucleotidyltransferase/DNA-binding XRE family transcriptional regulator